MKKIIFAFLLIAVFSIPVFAGGGADATPIKVWVGREAVEFYQKVAQDYISDYNARNPRNLYPYTIIVEAMDATGAAGTFLQDTTAGADIFTIPHNQLSQLVSSTSNSIGPVTSQALINQINADNPSMFLDVIKRRVGGQEYIFGVPYRSQSLVLFYNKSFLTETDVQTWEGILAKAKTLGKQSLTLVDTAGFNDSFLVLSTRESDGRAIADIYLNKTLANCNFTSDLAVAAVKWGQRFFTDSNGAKVQSGSGWEVELRNEATLCFIGGAWHYNAVRTALGSNLGIALLPNFTLTAADVTGTNIAASTVMRSGTFADTLMFVMKKLDINVPAQKSRADALQDLMLWLSKKSVQQDAFTALQQLPAYKNARSEFTGMNANTLEGIFARAQLDMFSRGRPQPFGESLLMNNYYYSTGAPAILNDILINRGSQYGTLQQIKDGLATIQRIWTTGRR